MQRGKFSAKVFATGGFRSAAGASGIDPGYEALLPRVGEGGFERIEPMKALTAFASAAALAMALAVAAALANAAVFAQFSPDSSAMDYKWVRDAAGTGGHFFSISSQTSTVAQGVK